jgi:WD40 repeat protein
MSSFIPNPNNYNNPNPYANNTTGLFNTSSQPLPPLPQHQQQQLLKQQESNAETPTLFINPQPYRIYKGHTEEIIDIAWSKSNFILSASMDKTVRLWHLSRRDCLQYFRHLDVVTSVDFDPIHDRYFISGCFDKRLRVWDIIPDGNVLAWSQTPDVVS